MKEKSELEQFLSSSSAAGRVESQGAFTLAAEVALRKIAEYQLPFEGAWAVKIVQSIVAAGSTDPIRVDLAASEIRFYFLATGFTLDEFSTAFHTPEPSNNRALRHLLSGLWPVALKERWGFQIAFPRQTETVIWDGEQMHRVESSVARDCTCISIAPLQRKTAFNWVAGLAMSGSRNAELLLALSRTCYACPLPLTVDGRRVDCLLRAENHGWTVKTYPLTVGFPESPLPEFRLPPGTFQGVATSRDVSSFITEDRSGGGWGRIVEKRLRELPARQSATLAFILSVNMKRVQSGKSHEWKDDEGPSTVHWILDGALVGTDELLRGKSHCSVGCFVSAEGLETDLSTFHVLNSTERAKRLELAREALAPALAAVDQDDFNEVVTRGRLAKQVLGAAMVVGGVAFLWGAAFPGLLLIIGGGVTIGQAGSSEEVLVYSARASIRDLSAKLRSRHYSG